MTRSQGLGVISSTRWRRLPGRVEDHCKTSGVMLAPRYCRLGGSWAPNRPCQRPCRAAALAAFLVSRTRASESPSTTSATDRNDPGSPYGALASTHPGGRTPSCLPRSAVKMAALAATEARQRRQARADLLAAVRGAPQARGVAVVALDDGRGQCLDPPGHGPGEPVHGRWRGADREEVLGVPGRDGARVQRALTEPLGELLRAEEGALHGDLLVQQHPGSNANGSLDSARPPARRG